MISNMYDRFVAIVNGLKNLERLYHHKDLNRRLLTPLPNEWISKITTVNESKDIAKLSIGDFIGSLLTYKIGIGKAEVGTQRLWDRIITRRKFSWHISWVKHQTSKNQGKYRKLDSPKIMKIYKSQLTNQILRNVRRGVLSRSRFITLKI